MDPNVNITEAGIDYFHISNANVLTTAETIDSRLTVFPNPFSDQLTIENAGIGKQFHLMNSQGQILQKGEIVSVKQEIALYDLPKGVYFLKIENEIFKVMKD
jgi:hypothetical protein